MLSRHPGERCVSALLLLCGLGHSLLDPIWHQWWVQLQHVCRTTPNMTQNLPDPRFLCIPPSFWKIPPTASYSAKSAGADPKSGSVRNLSLRVKITFTPTSSQTSANTAHHNRLLLRNLHSLYASKTYLNQWQYNMSQCTNVNVNMHLIKKRALWNNCSWLHHFLHLAVCIWAINHFYLKL